MHKQKLVMAPGPSAGPLLLTWCWCLRLAVLCDLDSPVNEVCHLHKLGLLEATGGQGGGANAHAAWNHGGLVT